MKIKTPLPLTNQISASYFRPSAAAQKIRFQERGLANPNKRALVNANHRKSGMNYFNSCFGVLAEENTPFRLHLLNVTDR